MSTKPFFITTPIYYVNDVPHIGHAYTTVAADVYARWIRSQGREVVLLTGTDEHGAKIAEAARAKGATPQEYVDSIAPEFKRVWESLGVGFDRFIRTTDADHVATVTDFIQRMHDRGFVYRGIYEGLYCVPCEKFWNQADLIDGKCPDHDKVPIPYKEENYFFALSRFCDELSQRISSDELLVRPEERKREILGKLSAGLEDISISRTNVSWGIALPFDPSHTIYVWIDALINYYTFGKSIGAWPADLHLIGKDILWFHSVIWPAMLRAAGEELPGQVFANGFFTVAGRKMSKTIGNVITPRELIERFGVDATRYLLLSAFPFGEDGDFDMERLTQKYNAELANGMGNFVARVTKLGEQIEGIIHVTDDRTHHALRPFHDDFQAAMARLDFYQATLALRGAVSFGDQYVNETKPWNLAGEEQRVALQNALGIVALIAHLARPFMPGTAEKIFSSLGIKGEMHEWGKVALAVKKGEALFSRIE